MIMYLAIIKQYVCPAFPDGLQYLDFKTKSGLFEYLGTLRLIDTPYVAIELKRGVVKGIVDEYMIEEVMEVCKKITERSEL